MEYIKFTNIFNIIPSCRKKLLKIWNFFIGKRRHRYLKPTTKTLVSSRVSKSFFISKTFWSFVTILCLSSFDGDCSSNNEFFVNKSYCKNFEIAIPILLAISIQFFLYCKSNFAISSIFELLCLSLHLIH